MFEKVNPGHPDKMVCDVLIEAMRRGAASMRKQANYKMKRADKHGTDIGRSKAIINLLIKAQMVDDYIKSLESNPKTNIPA